MHSHIFHIYFAGASQLAPLQQGSDLDESRRFRRLEPDTKWMASTARQSFASRQTVRTWANFFYLLLIVVVVKWIQLIYSNHYGLLVILHQAVYLSE
jgi:hypothetical protein